MEIFLSFEGEGLALDYLLSYMRMFRPKLDALQSKHYGDELDDIAIISTILKEDTLVGWPPERKLFKRKSKEADIRLRIDYNQIMKASEAERKQIYIDHIIQSIETLRHKVSKNYRFDELIADVKAVLNT